MTLSMNNAVPLTESLFQLIGFSGQIGILGRRSSGELASCSAADLGPGAQLEQIALQVAAGQMAKEKIAEPLRPYVSAALKPHRQTLHRTGTR